MTKESAQKLTGLVLLCLAALAFLMVASVIQAYDGRKDLVTSQRRGCERGKLDREANARGWRAAELARLSSLAKDLDISLATAKLQASRPPRANDPPDLTAARSYDEIASGQEQRSRIDCQKAFPGANLIP